MPPRQQSPERVALEIQPIKDLKMWEGHEFVDNIRDPGIWGGVKERIKGFPSVAVTAVAQLALAEVKKHLHLDKESCHFDKSR